MEAIGGGIESIPTKDNYWYSINRKLIDKACGYAHMGFVTHQKWQRVCGYAISVQIVYLM